VIPFLKGFAQCAILSGALVVLVAGLHWLVPSANISVFRVSADEAFQRPLLLLGWIAAAAALEAAALTLGLIPRKGNSN
jgi:hypothetical protein